MAEVGHGVQMVTQSGDGVALLEALRQAEFAVVEPYLPASARVLELGGGNGYQASLLAARGRDVVSLDVAVDETARRHFDVQPYDGVHIPYPDNDFDAIFSSHVLEHVQQLPALLAETQRVLRPGGVAVHVMPTTAWRFWTSLAHYPYVALFALGKARPFHGSDALPSTGDKMRSRGLGYMILKALSSGPHGEYPNALVELCTFSPGRWRGVLQRAGFSIEVSRPVGLFYTGYGLCRGWSTAKRRQVARLLGSGSHLYVARPKADVSGPGAD
jgi:SAM-dependent methyltransferase